MGKETLCETIYLKNITASHYTDQVPTSECEICFAGLPQSFNTAGDTVQLPLLSP